MKQEFMKSKVEPVIGWLLLAVLLFASTQMKVGSRLLVGLGFGTYEGLYGICRFCKPCFSWRFYKAYEVYGTYVFRFCCSFCGTDVF